MSSSISSWFAKFLSFAIGFCSLLALSYFAFVESISQRGRNRETENEDVREAFSQPAPRPQRLIRLASDELWSLQLDTPRFEHHFLRLPSGFQLHYISPLKESRHPNLIVFVHGFPDSCYLWAHFLSSTLCDQASLVSLDLPGYGGSDSLPRYGPDEVLSTVQLAIEALKEKYLWRDESASSPGRCIVVGHDWGGIVASRIAARTTGFADHLVLVNSTFALPENAKVPCREVFGMPVRVDTPPSSYGAATLRVRGGKLRLVAADQITLRINTTGNQVFRRANQLQIFLIQLSIFSARRFPSVARFLVSYCHTTAGTWPDRPAALQWAGSMGPSSVECVAGSDSAYGVSVGSRVHSIWDERMRLYQDGLLGERWTSKVTSTSAYDATDDKDGHDETKIRCGTTVVFGLKDQAISPAMAVDGIEDFIRPQPDGNKGLVVLLDDVGHWSPVRPVGTRVIEEVLLKRIQAFGRREKGHLNRSEEELPVFSDVDGVRVRRL